MYRLLITDDEPNIVDSLYELMLESLDMEMDIFRAYSGTEALERMRSVKIDVVLMDIDMPDINGLEAQKEIRRLWPRCKVIILSGYDDFRYVQSAMRSQGVDYILKSESDETVVNAVKKAIEAVDRELSQDDLIERMNRSMALMQPLLREKCLGSLLEGTDPPKDEISGQFAEYGIPFDPGQPVLLILGRVDGVPPGTGSVERNRLLCGVVDIANEYCSPFAQTDAVIRGGAEIVWFLQPKAGGEAGDRWKTAELFVRNELDSIQHKCLQLLDLRISIIVAGGPCCWADVARRYDLLRTVLYRLGSAGDNAILFEEAPGSAPERARLESEQRARTLLLRIGELGELLDGGMRAEFVALLTDIVNTVQTCGGLSFERNVELLYTLFTVFLSHVNQWGLEGRIWDRLNIANFLNAKGEPMWDVILANFTNLVDICMREKSDEALRSNNKIIDYIQCYVKQHLDSDLSLTNLSGQLHFNPSYLSRLFKQMTGHKLSDYIVSVKLHKARELLRNTDRRISDISSALGYNNPSHFAYFFKKHTGINPKEFRDS